MATRKQKPIDPGENQRLEGAAGVRGIEGYDVEWQLYGVIETEGTMLREDSLCAWEGPHTSIPGILHRSETTDSGFVTQYPLGNYLTTPLSWLEFDGLLARP